MKRRNFLKALPAAALTLAGCGQHKTAPANTASLVFDHSYPLDYATQFSADCYEGGYVMIDRWHAAAALIKSKIAGGENVIYLPVSAPKALSETVRTLGGLVKQYDTEADADSESLAAASGQTWQNDTILLALLFAAELGADRRILYAGEAFALAEKTIGVESAAAVIGELAAHGADTENGTLTLNFDDASVRVTAEDEHTVKLSAQAKTPRDAEDALRYAEKGIMESVHDV